jgi:hypothetical protein
MGTYYFKTNINCIGCASQVKPHLDRLEKGKEIKHWNVHLNTPDHLLEIVTDRLSPEELKLYLHEAGFEAEVTKVTKANKVTKATKSG